MSHRASVDSFTQNVRAFFILRPAIQMSRARRAGEPFLLSDWTMLSGEGIIDLGPASGRWLYRLDRLFMGNSESQCPLCASAPRRSNSAEET
jgi:hypothetical protein